MGLHMIEQSVGEGVAVHDVAPVAYVQVKGEANDPRVPPAHVQALWPSRQPPGGQVSGCHPVVVGDEPQHGKMVVHAAPDDGRRALDPHLAEGGREGAVAMEKQQLGRQPIRVRRGRIP